MGINSSEKRRLHFITPTEWGRHWLLINRYRTYPVCVLWDRQILEQIPAEGRVSRDGLCTLPPQSHAAEDRSRIVAPWKPPCLTHSRMSSEMGQCSTQHKFPATWPVVKLQVKIKGFSKNKKKKKKKKEILLCSLTLFLSVILFL